MREVFADTVYWLALLNPRDGWHGKARGAHDALGRPRLITTDEVLVEVLGFLRAHGPAMRQAGVQLVKRILQDPTVTVIPQSRESFLTGLSIYERRSDKEYSLTDCISMGVMLRRRLPNVLTNDHHFEQEGFTILLKE
ncbi:MAG TPA: nucleic acid-binding protein [Planctomycetota bacterium]|nr:nucleic acid-binding protein [Planctomycetota bacterium]